MALNIATHPYIEWLCMTCGKFALTEAQMGINEPPNCCHDMMEFNEGIPKGVVWLDFPERHIEGLEAASFQHH